MDKLYRDISVPTAGARVSDTIAVKGHLTPERQPVSIKLTSGSAHVTSAEAHEGRITLAGKLYFCCICEGEKSDLYSFSASADFSHDWDCSDSHEGYTPAVTAQLINISAKAEDEGINVSAEIDVFCRLEEKRTYHMLCECADVETKKHNAQYADREKVGESTAYVREDIVAANVGSVIYQDATAVIRDITAVADTARIDGILNLNALCLSKEGSFVHLRQNIPFTMDAETKYDNCKNLTGTVTVSDVRLRMTEDDYGLATIDAQIRAVLYASVPVPLDVTTDAFSPKEPFECICTPLQMLLFRETVEQKTVAKGTVRIPNMQEYAETVFCTVRPTVASAQSADNSVTAEGLLIVDLLYTDKTGNLLTASDMLPYSVRIPTSCENIEIDAMPVCTAINVGAAGDKGVEVGVTLSTTADIYEVCDAEIVTDTKPCSAPCVPSGLTVCFAKSGESIYDVAKLFCVSADSIRKANPGLGDTLGAGDRAILLR